MIDDTLSGWESEEEFDEFFEFLNTLHPGIKWTCEKEENGKLAIFDIQLIRDGKNLETTVYRKTSASDRYIHYTSWQAWKEKVGAIRTLKSRAHTYCSNEQLLADELTHLLEVFIQNGYPEKLVHRVLYKETKGNEMTQQTQKEPIDFNNSFYVPFHNRAKKLYDILLKKFGISTVFKKTQTLGNLIKKKGKQIEKRYTKNAVYKVPCGECEKSYMGQTKNTIDTRNGQHRAMCRRKVKLSKLKSSKKDNGLAFHHMQSGHEFDFNNTEIRRTDKDYYRRLILEGIEIKFADNLVNLQAGFQIDECWTPFLGKLYPGKNSGSDSYDA